MNEYDPDELQRLFDLAMASPAQDRDVVLERACGDTPGLKDRVLAMIESAESQIVHDETVRLDARTDDTTRVAFRRSAHGRFEPGQRIGDRYRIVALLGQGGMGEVYRADDLELGETVALKFLPEPRASRPEALDRFRQEVRTARLVTHPNVCRIHDLAEIDGAMFLSMAYVDGEDLASVLRRMGRPSHDKALEIARQLCDGLAAAHGQRVVHRDLKPANIMIDGAGQVRITDFGLAGSLDELESAAVRAGTPAYMAPEQLQGEPATAESDLYALGLVLYELFTGLRVFDADDVATRERLQARGSIVAPSSIVREIHPSIDRVILHCLDEDPDNRPSSIDFVREALTDAAALDVTKRPRRQSALMAFLCRCRHARSVVVRRIVASLIALACFVFAGVFLLGGIGLAVWDDAPAGAWFAIVVWIMLGAAGLTVGVVATRVAFGARVREGSCPQCGYDLREATGACPECGFSNDQRR